MKPLCLHCGTRPASKARGLCFGCYKNRAVRDLYPKRRAQADGGPTEAELDAMIAEQMRPENLPKWFHRDCRKQSPRVPKVYKLVRCG